LRNWFCGAAAVKLESDVERKVVADVERRGGIALKLNLQGNRGWPDRLALLPNGVVVFIEMKRPGEKLRKLQEHRRKTLQALGFTVLVASDERDITIALSLIELAAKGSVQ
jgi:hypothetical protein